MKNISGKLLQIAAYILLAVFFVIGIGILRNCEKIPTRNLEGFSQGDTIDLAILYGPGSLYFYSDTLSGINSELSRKFSDSSGKPIKLWPVADAGEAMNKLETGAFDILASLPLDNNLRKRFLTSESLFLDRLVLLQLTDSVTGEKTVKSSLDLPGKKIYVASGSSGKQRLQNLASEIGSAIEIIEVEDISDELLCLKVANGSLPLAVVNEKTAREVSKRYPLLSYDNPISFTQFQVWVFNNSDSLLFKSFGNWFEEFRTTEDYRNLLNNF